MDTTKYLIGQRVIYSGAICTVVSPPYKDKQDKEGQTWIFDPSVSFERHVDTSNCKPLPGGQL